jgi:hypothetical protein
MPQTRFHHRHSLIECSETQERSNSQLTSTLQALKNSVLDGINQSGTNIRHSLNQLTAELYDVGKQQKYGNDRLKQVEDILHSWHSQHGDALDRVFQSIEKVVDTWKRRSFQKAMLESLDVTGIDQRHADIKSSAEQTLKWVFEPPDHYQWSDMTRWLKGRTGLYWVSGKPGSGKSTLMKWLLHEPRTESYLSDWASQKQLLIVHHFFWRTGSSAQTSLSGLLRSLLYQILGKNPDMIASASPYRWRSYDLELQRPPAWSEEELLASTKKIFQELAPHSRVALFVDGLDECDENNDQQRNAANLLTELSSLDHMKVCVASRPLETFRRKYAGYPTLRLEDLTADDMRQYIQSTLIADPSFDKLIMDQPKTCRELAFEVLTKAEGVWLWVRLVVSSLLRGIENGDTANDLRHRLSEIPSELEAYFEQMLAGIEEVYRSKATRMLRIAMMCPNLPLVLYAHLDDTTPAMSMPSQPLTQAEFDQRIADTRARLNVRCLCLLEVVSRRQREYTLDRSSRHSERTKYLPPEVDFIHRTAYDYLKDNPALLVHVRDETTFDVQQYIMEACLATLKILPPEDEQYDVQAISHHFLRAARLYIRKLNHDFRIISSFNQELDARMRASASRSQRSIRMPLIPLAIEHGVNDWVKWVLRHNPRLLRADWPRPLLKIATEALVPDMELLELMLNLGSDPNEPSDGKSVWQRWLEHHGKFIDPASPQLRMHFIAVTELLLRYGAHRLLDRRVIIAKQRPGTTRVRYAYVDTLAVTYLRASFGDEEAERLDILAKWLEVSGQKAWVNSIRYLKSWLP